MKSEYLRIRVSERFRTKVEVAYSAAAAENLSDVIPPAMREQITGSDIDLAEISRSAIDGGLEPGELFSWECEGREIRAWLE